MSTNTLVAAVAGAATTVAVLLTIGVAPNVAAPVGLLIGGITALVLFVNSPAAVPAVPIASAPAKKSKKAAKKEAVKRAPTPPPADADSNSDASASEVSEDDAEETTQSKNAKKKAKKKQKEAEAKAAAAAAAKKAEEEKKKAAKKTAAPAPAPTPAAPVAKKDEGKKASKKNKEEKKAVAAPVPAPRTPSPPPQVEEEEEEFQTSKASKKKAKQDAKKAEKKEVDVPTPAPKKATPAPAPVAAVSSPVAAAPAPKKAEKKAAAPAPVVAAEEDGWETAKAAKPTIAQKQALKVANAEKKVEENTINTASDVYSEFVDIPARAVPAIIGSKGAVLKALQEGTQAKIEIPPASTRALDSLTVRVIVSGEPDAVRFAKTCVKSLAEKGFSAVTHPGFVSDDIYVESKQHGFIIGPKGTTLKTIQTKSGTRIQMPERGGNDRVLIVGPKEGVKAAKEAIKQLIADGFSSMTHEGTEKKEIEFPREKIGWLIGANGQTIKSIQGNTKCKINIPRDNSNVIVIVGPADKIAQAEKEILNTLKPKAKKGKKTDDNEEEEEEIDAEEKEVEAEQADAPQGNYNAWPSEEATATTEDQLWS